MARLPSNSEGKHLDKNERSEPKGKHRKTLLFVWIFRIEVLYLYEWILLVQG
jgi:hypothetical protein